MASFPRAPTFPQEICDYIIDMVEFDDWRDRKDLYQLTFVSDQSSSKSFAGRFYGISDLSCVLLVLPL